MVKTKKKNSVAKPTIEPTYADKAYLAGLFDGEGCVNSHFMRVKNGATYNYIRLDISQAKPECLYWVQARWGGSVHIRKNPNASHREHTRQICNWYLGRAEDVEQVLRDILPWLQVKDQQALTALELVSGNIVEPSARAMMHFKLKQLKTIPIFS